MSVPTIVRNFAGAVAFAALTTAPAFAEGNYDGPTTYGCKQQTSSGATGCGGGADADQPSLRYSSYVSPDGSGASGGNDGWTPDEYTPMR